MYVDSLGAEYGYAPHVLVTCNDIKPEFIKLNV